MAATWGAPAAATTLAIAAGVVVCCPAGRSQNSATGTRTRVARVRAEYPNQLDYSGACSAILLPVCLIVLLLLLLLPLLLFLHLLALLSLPWTSI